MNIFADFKVNILTKKPDNLEISNFDDRDIMLIEAIAIEEGLNANNALFERADLEIASDSFIGKPLRIRFINNNPTGHGFNRDTGKFDNSVENIGVVYAAEGEENADGLFQIKVTLGMWQKYYPEIANRLRQLHAAGDLKFSIEAEREFEITPEGYRRCFNILFNGLAVVANPAFENAKSLLVAELIEGGKNMDFERLYNDQLKETARLESALEAAKLATELSDKEKVAALGQVTEVSEKLAEKEGELKSVTVERDSLKQTIEVAEKAKIGTERLEKLTKYGEVEKTADELAEMSKEQFVDLLAEMVENFKPDANEQASKNQEVVGGFFSNEKKEKQDRKQDLLDLMGGLFHAAKN